MGSAAEGEPSDLSSVLPFFTSMSLPGSRRLSHNSACSDFDQYEQAAHSSGDAHGACEICSEDVTPSTVIRAPLTSSCTHGSKRLICRPCVQRHIAAQLSSWPHNQVNCWVPRCDAALEYNDIQCFAAPADFERYDQLLLRQAMEGADDTFKKCAYADCRSGGWCDPNTMSFIMCERCQRRTCVDCDITPYHSGQTCPNSPQAKRRGREDEDATVALVGRISKPCPNEECGARIQKIEGCDHMTCKKCRHEFCWLCSEPYGPIRRYGNSRHAEGCRYRSR